MRRSGRRESEERRPTCGELDVCRGGSGSGASLDEALLDRVNVALAAQAELARRTATQRVQTAKRLFDEAVVLTGRLRRQAALLRARIAERMSWCPTSGRRSTTCRTRWSEPTVPGCGVGRGASPHGCRETRAVRGSRAACLRSTRARSWASA